MCYNDLMRKTIIIRGPLGVGKTSIAKGVAKKLGGVHVSVGKILRENNLDRIGEKHIPLENYLKVNSIIEVQVRPVEGILVIDGNFYYKEQLKDLKKRLSKPFIIFTLTASLDTCIRRDILRDKPQGKEAAIKMHNLVSLYKTGIIIDTENKSQGEVLGEVLSRLEKKLK